MYLTNIYVLIINFGNVDNKLIIMKLSFACFFYVGPLLAVYLLIIDTRIHNL